MTTSHSNATFDHYRKSLEIAGIPTTSGNSLVCPLCWQETPRDQLTLEHIVPSSVGGKQTILTCRRCNNDHGRDLDAHLAQRQKVADAFKGHGVFEARLNVNGHKLAANLEWGDGHKNFRIVGDATDPAACKAAQEAFSTGNVSRVDFTLLFRYARNNFQTAVLRCAYLVLFKCFGYEYANHEVVQTIRRRIADPSLGHPRLSSLVLEARHFTPPYDSQHYVVPGRVNGVEFFLVIIRVRRATTTFLGAYLPVPVYRCGEFFGLMEQYVQEHNGEALSIPPDIIFG